MVNEPVSADESKPNCIILHVPTKDHAYLVMTRRIMPGDQLIVDYGLGTITATNDDFVLRQWEPLALRCIIGPRIGHSSDGDSR